MYHALYNRANFIVLDDPISSFDKNKKFAILDMLFIRGNSFRGKTTLLLTHDFEPVIDAIYNHPSFFEGTPVATYMENNSGALIERVIEKSDIQSAVQIAETNVRECSHVLSKLIYLRRYTEITAGKNMAWHLLSNLFHKRQTPMIGANAREMTEEEVSEATQYIRQFVEEFEYSKVLISINNRDEMKQLFTTAGSNYEKLQIYRLLFGTAGESLVVRKFLNETYHVENDYLFQLNPINFSSVPNYLIDECRRVVESEG